MQTTKVSAYDQQALDLLAEFGISFSADLIGKDCPPYCPDAETGRDMDKLDSFPRQTHMHGKHYRGTFQRIGGKSAAFSIDFWNSYADEEQNYACSGGRNMPALAEDYRLCNKYRGKARTHVTTYDVLACLQKSDPGTFENFCGDFGYDTDSRKAESTYRAVCAEWRKVQTFFHPKEIEALQEVQ